MTPKQLLSSIALVCLLLWTQVANAQNKTISGKVTDSKDGAAISGATVQPKGTRKGVTTGTDGSFKISVEANVTKLVISSVGFASQEIDISGKTEITVSLVVTNTSLNEVVVVGYGTRKVKDATGSVASLSPKDFNKGVISTPEQLLQGRIPGVIVSPSSGEPGAASTINIRGSASIRSSQEPLYVVDGVPISPGGTSSNNESGVEGSSTPKNPLSFLNPNDIESISVLKDASSAAIYGSRGANGVILITTKGGRGGKKGSFSFSAATSVSTKASKYNLLNAQDFLYQVKKANIEQGASPENAAIAILETDKGASTDWQKQIYQTGVSQNYNLSWGFSQKVTALRVSGSYDDQQGIIKNSSLKRLTGRANLTQKFLNDKLKFDVTLTYSNVKNQYPPISNTAGYQGSLIGATIGFNPTYPIFNKDGTYYDPGDGSRNPAEMLAYFDDRDKINRFLTSVSGSYEILKGLVYKATFGYDQSKSERLSFADPRLGGEYGRPTNVFGVDFGNGISGNGRGVKQKNDLKTILVEHTVAYDKAFNNGDVINAVVGYSYQSTVTQYHGNVGWGLATPVVKASDVFAKDYNGFKKYGELLPDYTKYELQSYFARINYTIRDKYLLTATFRADGSTKFGTNNKYGYFPAFAAKWRVLKEGFAENSLGKLFSDFSLRANWGKLGSQEGIGAYDAYNFAQTWYNGAGIKQTQLVHVGNPDLKWEESTTTGAGLDFATKNNRFSGTIDYYYTERKNILFYTATPGGFSASAFWFVNLPGKVVNKGWEIGLNYKAIKGKKFSWDINYNMTLIHNELKDFPTDIFTGTVRGKGLSGAYAQIFTNGSPLFSWYMPTFEGFDGNGNSRFKDGTAAGAPSYIQGSALPKFLAGLTNSFTWGNWSASIFLNSVTGFKVYNNTANANFIKGSIRTAQNITYESANTNENPLNAAGPSSRFLEKGDFIRLSNVSLSHLFNVKSKVIKTLSVYASGQNLALWTKYSGLDPEVNVDQTLNGVPSRGFDYTGFPKSRTYTLGVNLGF